MVIAPGVGAARIEVGVDVQHRERTVRLRDRAKDRCGDRVIPADHERDGVFAREAVDQRVHRLAHRRPIERREHDVAAVDRADPGEHVDAMTGVIVLHEPARTADVKRCEPRAGLIRGAAIVRHPEDDRVGRFSEPELGRQPEERGLAVAQVLEGG
jgi:hypothetical protein